MIEFIRLTQRICLLVVICLLGSMAFAAGQSAQLIVFTQPGVSSLANEFEEQHLPVIRDLASKAGVEFREVNVATDGAPAEVGITPLIVFQNARGRSVFQGRYTDPGKIRNFIRTSRVMPQGDAAMERRDVGVMEAGRAKVVASIKVTGLEGELAADFHAGTFESTARDSIFAALEGFDRRDTVALGRSDRTFYLDFYPYWYEDGDLAVSGAIYSQFNCHEPIYTMYEDPPIGPFSDADKLFRDASGRLRAEALRQISESEVGDGFDAVPESTAVKTWEDLGLALPVQVESEESEAAGGGTVTAQRWVFEAQDQEEGVPILQFHFAAPLDNYAGEAKTIRAGLTLGEDMSLSGATGFVAVPVSALTMGEPGLDSTVVSLLNGKEFPDSQFELSVVHGGAEQLRLGETAQIAAEGTLTIGGVAAPASGVRAEITPVFNDAGEPRLDVTASFSIRLKESYGIDGTDGPAPANETVEYFLHFVMRPADPANK